MSLRPLVKHPGGKSPVAEVVADLLGNPPEVCEPFAGGLAVSMLGGMRPVFTAEVIPPIRALYNQLAQSPATFWSELACYPSSIDTEAEFNELRYRFNFPGGATPARYAVLNASCFNGLARFNRAGRFNASVGAPLPRPIRQFDAAERAAYEARFAGCVCFEDWRQAVAAAIAAGVPIYCDPPYVGTFSYAGKWGLGDLAELADALPVGALVSERADLQPEQPGLFPVTAEGVLLARGFERIHTWAARDSISCGERRQRSEGIWRKVAA